MKITKSELRRIIREEKQRLLDEAAAVRIDPALDPMVQELRNILGDEEFINVLLSKLNARDLKRVLRDIASHHELKIGGIQYF